MGWSWTRRAPRSGDVVLATRVARREIVLIESHPGTRNAAAWPALTLGCGESGFVVVLLLSDVFCLHCNTPLPHPIPHAQTGVQKGLMSAWCRSFSRGPLPRSLAPYPQLDTDWFPWANLGRQLKLREALCRTGLEGVMPQIFLIGGSCFFSRSTNTIILNLWFKLNPHNVIKNCYYCCYFS